ncbi:MAG: AbrB/MazE/SpoVT family DNA-binding domain-containing protein [Armatimonadetes bacterium]|nr:AbrB/MazE/SpoVT family DNA-binding domain-containing protein [Armatimonadota bacterium]
MPTLTVGSEGEISLPDELRERYGLKPDTPVRVIETQSGLLLIPLTDAPISPELARELAEWQSASAETWDLFPYEEDQ